MKNQKSVNANAQLIQQTREMIMKNHFTEYVDEHTLFMHYQDFCLQISFTDQHPLMYFQFVRDITLEAPSIFLECVNELNLKSVLGTHSINLDKQCYIYRTVHWLECPISPVRYFEILQRCADEAARGYSILNFPKSAF